MPYTGQRSECKRRTENEIPTYENLCKVSAVQGHVRRPAAVCNSVGFCQSGRRHYVRGPRPQNRKSSRSVPQMLTWTVPQPVRAQLICRSAPFHVRASVHGCGADDKQQGQDQARTGREHTRRRQ